MIRSQRDLAEIKQPGAERLTSTEKLLLRYESGREWAQNNQRVLAAVAVVLIAIVGGLWWWAGQRKTNNEFASTYLSRALNYYFQGDYRHSVDGDKTRKIS